MIKSFLAGVAAAAMLASVAGCSQTFSDIVNTAASPAATQAAANAQAVANAFVCEVSAVAGAVATGLKAGNAKGQTVTTIIYTSTAALCALKGGTTAGVATVPASAVATQ